MSDKTIGARITAARERAGMNKNRLARALGTSWQHVDHWERDRTVPAAGSLRRLAEVLGVGVGELLGDSPSPSDAFHAFLAEHAPPDLTDTERDWLCAAPIDAGDASPERYAALLAQLRGTSDAHETEAPRARTGRRPRVRMEDVERLAELARRSGG